MRKSYKLKVILLQLLLVIILFIAFKYIIKTPCFTLKRSNNNDISPAIMNISNKENDNINVSEEADKSQGNLILVNKTHPLSKDYVPKDLYSPKVKFYKTASQEEKSMRKEAAFALEELFNNAHKNGVELYGLSGYRSYSTQKSLYFKACVTHGKGYADRQVAKAGLSEHQTGLSMDVTNKNYSPSFEITKEGKWLYKNCYKAGFILRFPLNKESVTGYNYEPWHIRYVGKAAAKKIFSQDITLEEYLKN